MSGEEEWAPAGDTRPDSLRKTGENRAGQRERGGIFISGFIKATEHTRTRTECQDKWLHCEIHKCQMKERTQQLI